MNIAKKNFFLIGPMGAGKSTIGRHLARALGFKFFDSDQEIETRTGVDLQWIFDVEGEAGYLRREEAVILELTQLQGIVLATGGSAILSPKTRSALASTGTVIYLKASLDQQQQRTAKDKRRPLLQTQNLRETLITLNKEREPHYQALADLTFTTDSSSVTVVVEEMLRILSDP